ALGVVAVESGEKIPAEREQRSIEWLVQALIRTTIYRVVPNHLPIISAQLDHGVKLGPGPIDRGRSGTDRSNLSGDIGSALHGAIYEFLHIVAQTGRNFLVVDALHIDSRVRGDTDRFAQAGPGVVDHRPGVLKIVDGLSLDLLCQED